MPRSWATSIIGFCAAICVSRLAPSGIEESVKPLIMSMTISAGRSPKPIFTPKPRCLKKSSSSLPLVMCVPSHDRLAAQIGGAADLDQDADADVGADMLLLAL